jgi:peptidoglycan hydrolase-like protein with peptidoglycan-binding domain
MPATIRLGDSGEDVRRLQRVLARMKVLAADRVDGSLGSVAELAVKDFQQSEGLTVDGVVGPNTWNKLPAYREASPSLHNGSLGPVVAMVQRVLKNGFGYSGEVDGIYGSATATVIRTYQQHRSLPATGALDERTWMAPAGAAGATLESLCGLTMLN